MGAQDYRNIGRGGEPWRLRLGRIHLDMDGPSPRGGDSMVVTGDAGSGFRLAREIDMPRRFWNWTIGDAGLDFEAQRDAEGYGLLAAMYIRGDLHPGALPEPISFGGFRDDTDDLAAVKRRIFFHGAEGIDPGEGWDDIDPEGVLLTLPHFHDPFHTIYDDVRRPMSEQIADDFAEVTAAQCRVLGIIEAVEIGLDHYRAHALTRRMRKPYLRIVADLADDVDDKIAVRDEDRGYVALLLLSQLRGAAPARWFFPGQEDEIRSLIPRLRDSLSETAIAAIERLRTDPDLAMADPVSAST